jgi:glycosyltransferase involved in cell wall biosynthesis
MDDNICDLSVCVRSYNQKEYLRIAIESILSQKTTFDFEIIISDDCSTDGTIEMLNEYAERYPNKIRLVFGECNIGGPLNLKRVIEAACTKYIALMDGDDYWVDDYKLQKQYDFMQLHPEYVGCFHNAYVASGELGKYVSLFNNHFIKNPVLYQSVITEHWFMPTSSEFLVKDKIIFPDWYSEVANDDYVINLGLALSGPFYYMKDVMSIYRYHSANVSQLYRDTEKLCTNMLRIYRSYADIYPVDAKPLFEKKIVEYEALYKQNVLLLKQPWRKWFMRKTYTRVIKQWFRHKLRI